MTGRCRPRLPRQARITPAGATKSRTPPSPAGCRSCSYQYLAFSDGGAAAEGTWASGPTPDGEFSYHDGPTTTAPMPPPTRPDARTYGTTDVPNAVEKAGTVQDKLDKE